MKLKVEGLKAWKNKLGWQADNLKYLAATRIKAWKKKALLVGWECETQVWELEARADQSKLEQDKLWAAWMINYRWFKRISKCKN